MTRTRTTTWRRALAALRLTSAALSLAGCGGASADAYRPVTVGEPAPAFAAPTLAGDTVRVGPGARAPLTLVNVWATWCGPCRDEFPELEAIHRAYAARGLRVVGVSIDHAGDDAVRAFVKAEGATFLIARDPEARVQDAFQSLGVPESYLVAPDGTLLWRGIGALPKGAAGVRAAIEKYLVPKYLVLST